MSEARRWVRLKRVNLIVFMVMQSYTLIKLQACTNGACVTGEI